MKTSDLHAFAPIDTINSVWNIVIYGSMPYMNPMPLQKTIHLALIDLVLYENI